MTRRVRRRSTRDLRELREWSDDRDELMDRCRRSGLGTRPEAWWRYESGRPDLAASPGIDTYVHLREDPDHRDHERACERLRFLMRSGELTEAERSTIAREAATERTPGRWAWRAHVLQEFINP
jgi:hypothetical protein